MQNTEANYTSEQMALINELVMAKMELNHLWNFHPENEEKLDIVEQYNIIKEVEKKAKKTSAQQEIEHQEKAMAMTKMMLNEVLRANQAAQKTPPSRKKKTIIMPD